MTALATQYYRPPRRVPRSEGESQPRRSRLRDFFIFAIGLFIVSIILFGVSYFFSLLGLNTMSLGIWMFAFIFVFVSIGIGFTVGLTYFIMQSFLKREFKKRFDRMDQERYARYRKMMGIDETKQKETD
ncbi:MAG: hypothetical protein ACFFDU_08950 [Candidatus Thorarchaeota archaeon]